MNFDPLFNLSSHFTLGEMSRTDNRLLLEKNHAEALWYLDNLQRLCVMVLEPVRTLLGIPIHVTSGFRCNELNVAIGGSPTSQHCHGEAADTTYEGHDLKEIFNAIAFSDVPYSQIIYEFGSWIHLGLQDSVLYPGKVKQMLTASSMFGKTVYEKVVKPL